MGKDRSQERAGDNDEPCVQRGSLHASYPILAFFKNMEQIPVIIDTDLGDDIDDTWALAYALRCPELTVQFVLTAGHGQHEERARIAAKLLAAAGTDETPIGLGCDRVLPSASNHYMFQEGWAEDSDASRRAIDDGVGFMIALINKATSPITILAIGAMDNIAAALSRDPGIAARCHLVTMLGSVYRGYDGPNGQAQERNIEFNVRENPAACRTVLAAPWLSRTMAPLDTATLVRLRGEPFARLLSAPAPLPRAVAAASEFWYNNLPAARRERLRLGQRHETNTSCLYDLVAVHLCCGAAARTLLKVEPVRLSVTDEGWTIPTLDDNAPSIDVALDWYDLNAFCERVVSRLIGA